jgi:hypothetical protein
MAEFDLSGLASQRKAQTRFGAGLGQVWGSRSSQTAGTRQNGQCKCHYVETQPPGFRERHARKGTCSE